MTITLLQMLYSLVLVQSTTYGLYSAQRQYPRGLTLFLLGVSAHMLLNLVYEWQLLNSQTDFSFGWASLYGPAFYFYIRTLSLHPVNPITGVLHFIPFFMVNLGNIFGFSGHWLGPVIGIQLMAYLAASALFVYRSYQLLPAQHSEPVSALMKHTKTMLGLFAALLIYDSWARSQPATPIWLGLSFSEMTLFGVLLLINLMFLRQITIPAAQPLPSSKTSFTEPETNQESSDSELAQTLMAQTREERLFQTPNLTLAQLAERFALSEKQCSELLNNQLHTTFSDFINQLRVEACQQALLHKPDVNVLEIGFEYGFNSKTAFNTAFKKFTGQTPTQYRKSERSDLR